MTVTSNIIRHTTILSRAKNRILKKIKLRELGTKKSRQASAESVFHGTYRKISGK